MTFFLRLTSQKFKVRAGSIIFMQCIEVKRNKFRFNWKIILKLHTCNQNGYHRIIIINGYEYKCGPTHEFLESCSVPFTFVYFILCLIE